jgi:hypothetical protein
MNITKAYFMLPVEDMDRATRFYRDVLGLIMDSRPLIGRSWHGAIRPSPCTREAVTVTSVRAGSASRSTISTRCSRRLRRLEVTADANVVKVACGSRQSSIPRETH